MELSLPGAKVRGNESSVIPFSRRNRQSVPIFCHMLHWWYKRLQRYK